MSENLRSGRPKGKADKMTTLSVAPKMRRKKAAKLSIKREARFEMEEDYDEYQELR
jgi:hypothetical protein